MNVHGNAKLRPAGRLALTEAIVVDEQAALVSSANLTEAAFDRDIEVGILTRDQLLAGSPIRAAGQAFSTRRGGRTDEHDGLLVDSRDGRSSRNLAAASLACGSPGAARHLTPAGRSRGDRRLTDCPPGG